MSKRTPTLLLEDILDAANKILDYTNGMTYEEFYGDNKSVDAVCRNFEIIGEAAPYTGGVSVHGQAKYVPQQGSCLT